MNESTKCNAIQCKQSALDGYNVCLFAYGQTGSGKTYTMQGAGGASSEHRGLIPRSVEQIMESTRRLQKQGWSYKMSASVLELYNDAPKDLLLDTRSVHGVRNGGR